MLWDGKNSMGWRCPLEARRPLFDSHRCGVHRGALIGEGAEQFADAIWAEPNSFNAVKGAVLSPSAAAGINKYDKARQMSGGII
ncbi:hypothetical protein TNCV_4007021 [Trichonephila clavipes]|nr:hypothetical protein TNCV_4007021 [Trichonephila clavipes]